MSATLHTRFASLAGEVVEVGPDEKGFAFSHKGFHDESCLDQAVL